MQNSCCSSRAQMHKTTPFQISRPEGFQNVANVASVFLYRKLRHFKHFQNVAPKCSTTFSFFRRIYAYFSSSQNVTRNVASYSSYFIVYIGLDSLLHSWHYKNIHKYEQISKCSATFWCYILKMLKVS